MQTMTPTQKIAYRLFQQTLILLVLYALVALLVALKFLSPSDPLADSLPYNQVGTLAHILLNLTVLTGLLSGGVYIISQETIRSAKLLDYTAWLWTALLILAVAGGLLGFTSGRYGIELPPLLQIGLIAALSLFIGNILLSAARLPVIQVWSIGLALSVLSALIALLPFSDYVTGHSLRALVVGVNINLAYPLAGVALAFWLMHRFSNITPAWAEGSLYTVAGMLAVAGVLLILPHVYVFGAPDWVRTLGSLAAMIVPILYLIFAAHSYRALSDRNNTYTLAAHWYALSLLLFLLGAGLLGAVQALPGVNPWTSGTRLTDVQAMLMMLAVVMLSLGIINQATAELRGQNRRVTGLMPFWLIAFGVTGSAAALGGAGLVQTYLERILSIGYLDTQTLLIPLYTGWAAGLVALVLGAILYSLIFWLRRPGA